MRGLRVLLLERDDFGCHTSSATLRMVHGGLRYLRQADLPRFFESVEERRWYLSHFPDLVRPLPCVLPLDGRNWRKASLMRVALQLNDALSWRHRRVPAGGRAIPRSKIIDSGLTADLVGEVIGEPAPAGAVWHDAIMLSSERVLIEMLRWAASLGSTVLNYVEASGLQVEKGRVRGVLATDRVGKAQLVFRSGTVINCAGPWIESVASSFRCRGPALFARSVAFNLLLDSPKTPAAAVAVPSKTGSYGMYFLVPWKGRLLAGTMHLPASNENPEPTVSEREVQRFLDELVNATAYAPGELRVRRVYSGFLPAVRAGSATAARRAHIVDHSRVQGPKGVYSAVGVKWTTARKTADRVLRRAFPDRTRSRSSSDFERKPGADSAMLVDAAKSNRKHEQAFARRVESVVRDESVVHADDAVLRRMDGVYDPDDLLRIGRLVCSMMDLEAGARDVELRRVLEASAPRPTAV